MVEIFYRWHQATAPAFSPDNAYSADWGSEFTPDGSKYRAPSAFEGEYTGDGTDGEPLSVPSRVVRTLTWSQLLTEQGAA